jgi:RecJ-like exonuclease
LKAFCISHIKDVDGIGAAAIVVAATGATVLLSDYSYLLEALDKVPVDSDLFVLCDLGSDNSNAGEFVARMCEIASRSEVTYIDHHLMSAATKQRLTRAGVRVVHDERECSSMLTYETYRAAVPERARVIALLGAVTDYMDGSPMAAKMMEQADRQFILLEATMLAFAVAKKGSGSGFPEMVVRELSKMKLPHEIEGVATHAVEQLSDAVRLGEEVKRRGKKEGRIAYMVTSQHSTGNVAKLLIGAFEVPVGVALKEQEKGWYEVSLRCTTECKAHLGRVIEVISSQLGGSGGGHRKAAGCRIPTRAMQQMLDKLKLKV